jgi:hypothetical protein
MRLLRDVLLVCLVTGAAGVAGCGDDGPKGMPNMKPGTGPLVEKQMPLKKGGRKPMLPEPPGPQAPP